MFLNEVSSLLRARADFPVSESRVSQLKKEPRKSKSYKIPKQKTLAQMPISWTRRSLVKRFNANNPLADSQEIDFDAYLNIYDYEFYHDLVAEFARVYPKYEWYYSKERNRLSPPEGLYDLSIFIRMKLYWTDNGKYAHVKGTIPKKDLKYVRDRLFDKFLVEWPLVEVERPEERPYLSEKDLAEEHERAMEHYREPEEEEDEEMRKWGDLVPEE